MKEVHVVIFEVPEGFEVKVYSDWVTARFVERDTGGTLYSRNVEDEA